MTQITPRQTSLPPRDSTSDTKDVIDNWGRKCDMRIPPELRGIVVEFAKGKWVEFTNSEGKKENFNKEKKINIRHESYGIRKCRDTESNKNRENSDCSEEISLINFFIENNNNLEVDNFIYNRRSIFCLDFNETMTPYSYKFGKLEIMFSVEKEKKGREDSCLREFLYSLNENGYCIDDSKISSSENLEYLDITEKKGKNGWTYYSSRKNQSSS